MAIEITFYPDEGDGGGVCGRVLIEHEEEVGEGYPAIVPEETPVEEPIPVTIPERVPQEVER